MDDGEIGFSMRTFIAENKKKNLEKYTTCTILEISFVFRFLFKILVYLTGQLD